GVSFTNDACPRSRRLPLAAVAARYRNKTGWLVRTSVENGASLGARCVILPITHALSRYNKNQWRMGRFGKPVTSAGVEGFQHAIALCQPHDIKMMGTVRACVRAIESGYSPQRFVVEPRSSHRGASALLAEWQPAE